MLSPLSAVLANITLAHCDAVGRGHPLHQFSVEINMFRARKADRLKLLYWDGTGLVMAYNDLHSYCISLSHSVEGFGLAGIFLMSGEAIDELVPSTGLLLR